MTTRKARKDEKKFVLMPTRIYSYLENLGLSFYLRDQKLQKIIDRVDFLRN
jgi:hypothetical protein